MASITRLSYRAALAFHDLYARVYGRSKKAHSDSDSMAFTPKEIRAIAAESTYAGIMLTINRIKENHALSKESLHRAL